MRHLFLVLLAVFGAACNETSPGSPAPSTSPTGEQALVVHVSDGDSVIVEINGTEQKVRLIGINAPERDECYGPEARERLGELVDNRRVTLVSDLEPTDQYDRLLRYVYVDGLFVNEELVRGGNAMARSYEPNTAREEALSDAQAEAREAGRGMWSEATCSASGDLVIAEIEADAPGPDDENLNGEWVDIVNRGSSAADLGGWSLRDAESANRYTFPAGTEIGAGASLRISTGCGENSISLLHWCSETPVWNNRGDVAFLLDGAGKIVDRYEY